MASPLQRIKGAIDRTIAEEQARQKAHAAQNNAATPDRWSRTDSSRAAARGPRTEKPTIDTSKDAPGETVPTPDPATFEASFAIEDEDDEPSAAVEAENGDGGADAAKPTAPPQEQEEMKGQKPAADSNGAESGAQVTMEPKNVNGGDAPPPPVELPPDVQVRLKKLDKLEKVYKSMSPAGLDPFNSHPPAGVEIVY